MITEGYFSSKPYVVTLHLNRLVETVQMMGHNIRFYAKLIKTILNYHQILPIVYELWDCAATNCTVFIWL